MFVVSDVHLYSNDDDIVSFIYESFPMKHHEVISQYNKNIDETTLSIENSFKFIY